PDKVLFRLPKADTEYDYYDADGSIGDHKTTLGGKVENKHHMLNAHQGTIKAVAAEGSEYFLVGNPFMTNMDIEKFLKTNEEILENKYWLVTANSQIAGTFTDDNAVSTGNVDSGYDATAVAPMQGFFVKAKEGAVKVDGDNSTIELNYDQSMMRRFASKSTTALPNTTRSGGSGLDAIRVVAENDGVVSSSALIATGYAANSMKSVEAIDNRGLDIPATVYTIGNGQALSINFCNDAEGVEIGVAADADTETVIRFEGVQPGCDLSLLDKEEYSLTSLYAGMEIQLKGAAAGRYFLTRSSGIEEVYSGIEWSVEGNTLVVYDRSCSGSLDVKVFDTLGREVASDSTNGDSVRVALPHGVYVVEIANASERKSAKIRM
ncbi:MAG: T9SS type A sorting domain-containing protein, partial [Muribaculaceae bacterium]|nr:T9SS type A sorting domain-containing protein [Muribaculaceae bacterium]